MKFLLLLLSFSYLSLCAQTGVGIYKIKWFVDKRLTNRFMMENTGFGNAGMGRLEIPTGLQDSVIKKVTSIVQDELRTDVAILFPTNSKGKALQSAAGLEWVGGLPRGTRKQAIKTEYKEYYVKFKIHVGVNKVLTIGNEAANYSRLHPYVRVKMKAYGVDRRLKFRKRSRKSGFNSLGSFEFNVGGVTMTNSNALPIVEIVNMVFQGLQRFEEKVK